jgi:hypothetical protein
LAFGGADPRVGVFDSDGQVLWQHAPEILDYWVDVDKLRLSRDGSVAEFGFKTLTAHRTWKLRLARFSLAERQLSLDPTSNPSLEAPRTDGLDIANWKNSYKPTLNGQALPLEQYETSRSLAISADAQSFLLGTEWYLRRFDRQGKQLWSVPGPGTARLVNLTADSRYAVAGFGDGTIRWYDATKGQEVLALFVHPDGRRWVVWTPAGYYDTSPGGEELIGWHVNNSKDRQGDFYPVSRFRGAKYRPDVVSKVLEAGDEAQAVRLADAEREKKTEDTTIAAALPPVVTITSPENGSQVSVADVTLHYRVRTPNGEPVTGIRALVDGRPVADNRGVKLAVKEGEEQTLAVTIPGRDCEVSVIAENRFAASVPARVRLAWAGTEPSDPLKPKLYLLAVGISAYQNQDLRLGYPAKDARDFAAAMQAQEGQRGLYRKVEVKLLRDAPKDDILDGLEWLQQQVTSRDVGVIFLAGHGVDDPNGVYYFLPANVDLDHLKRTALIYTDIKTTLTSIAGKAVMFVDTCHSGNVMGARRGVADINAVVNELASAENGVVVFAASTGRQYSLEDPQWQNGAFTKALVEGIGGKAEVGDKGKITIDMLDLYISERVKELTGGRQTPTTTKPSTVPDFPLAVKQ